MKKLLLLIAFILPATFIFGQTLSLSDTEGAIESGATLYVMGDPTDFIITKEISVTNNGGETFGVLARKVETNVLAGTSNYFCWGACYSPFVFVSSDTVFIEAGQTVDEFYGDYTPGGVAGKSTIMYSWWIVGNPSDSVYVYVEFNASPAGFGEAGLTQLNIYPNPASEKLTIEYDGGNEIVISNLLGAIVKKVAINQVTGKTTIDVSDLQDGIYFYTLLNASQSQMTGKFIVRR